MKKRNAPRSAEEVRADIERAPLLNAMRAEVAKDPSPLLDSLSIVQHARELEARRGRTNALPDGAFALQRLMVALLETLSPEQRAEVRRRLGE